MQDIIEKLTKKVEDKSNDKIDFGDGDYSEKSMKVKKVRKPKNSVVCNN